MNRRSAPMLVLTSALLAASAHFVEAKDAKPQQSSLPGVTKPEPIVKPMPADDADVRGDKDGWVKVGDTYVRISGRVTVDIGTGTRSTNR